MGWPAASFPACRAAQLTEFTAIERLFAGGGEVQNISSLPSFAAKPLAKHFRDIGLVVDDENAETHEVVPVIVA
jgi:hypothetical protein